MYTTISPSYCPDWSVIEALRELVQEGLDVSVCYGCRSTTRWTTDGWFEVEDDGPGLSLSSLVMGVSGKREVEGTIGQFGEGLKLACLVLARLGRAVEIETVGCSLRPVIATHPDFGCLVLAFENSENARTRGTLIRARASEDEFNSVREMFLALTPSYFYTLGPDGSRPATSEDTIFLPGGRIFVNGVLVSVEGREGQTPFLFSYNFKDKSLVNRDRWAVNFSSLTNAICDEWARCDNKALINRLLRTLLAKGEEYVEILQGLAPRYLSDERLQLWREAAGGMFKNVLVQDTWDSVLIRRVSELGYTPLSLNYRWSSLLEQMGVSTVRRVNEELGMCDPVSLRALEPLERFNLYQVRRLIKRYLSPFFKGVEVDIVPARFVKETKGYAESGVAYVNVTVLKDIRQALSTAIHEFIHIAQRAEDYTDEFTDALQLIIADLLLERVTKRQKDTVKTKRGVF